MSRFVCMAPSDSSSDVSPENDRTAETVLDQNVYEKYYTFCHDGMDSIQGPPTDLNWLALFMLKSETCVFQYYSVPV